MSSRIVRVTLLPRIRLGSSAIVCGAALLACAATMSSRAEPTAQPGVARDASEIAPVPLVERGDFDATLTRLKGQVVLVDCWATWCGPCVEQLPHSIGLARDQHAAGLAVITLNFDDADSADAVRTQLAKAGAAAAGVYNLQCKLGGSPAAMDEFEVTSGALPHYKLYNRQGKLCQVFELDPAAPKQYTTADIDAAVKKLLASE